MKLIFRNMSGDKALLSLLLLPPAFSAFCGVSSFQLESGCIRVLIFSLCAIWDKWCVVLIE